MLSRQPGTPRSTILANELPVLKRLLERASTPEEKRNALGIFLRTRLPDEPIPHDLDAVRRSLSHSPTGVGSLNSVFTHPEYFKLFELHGVGNDYISATLQKGLGTGLEKVPCAALDHGSGTRNCTRQGTQACANCRLVLYCSKECQRKHWRIHKEDCKDPIRDAGWKPSWLHDRRPPSFDSETGFDLNVQMPRLRVDPPSLPHGTGLWGNLPAYDILKLSTHELPPNSKSCSVLSAASSDLRNLIVTVNALPPDFPQTLSFILNDSNDLRIIRTIIIMLILTSVPDRITAADIALHVWYSAFLSKNYEQQTELAAVQMIYSIAENLKSGLGVFQKQVTMTVRLGGHLDHHLLEDVLPSHMGSTYGADVVHADIERVRVSPFNADPLHRRYCQLEPAHRQAAHHFRKTGVLLPFGAATAHFDRPNRFMLSPTGKWIEDDLADPLLGWPIEDVMEAGKAHGVQRADVYGALYFYLMDQLRTFIDRLHTLKIQFFIFKSTPSEFVERRRSGALSVPWSINPGTCFNRIDVGKLGDVIPGGWARVASEWGTMLLPVSDALVGMAVSWADGQGEAGKEARPSGEVVRMLTAKLMQEGKIPKPSRERSIEDILSVISAYKSSFTAMYDTSPAFIKYLDANYMELALRQNGLRINPARTIIPLRIGARADAPPDALPDFPDAESWYLNVNLVGRTWTERSLEIRRLPMVASMQAPEPKAVEKSQAAIAGPSTEARID
ncbi:hypothetical protein DENSPDRAFT_798192 [Dentipellis sp. KUC8613]|nr:hypothetical protein DENSPDRAFT_798192 [Dentipellis sp. KUC8613]